MKKLIMSLRFLVAGLVIFFVLSLINNNVARAAVANITQIVFTTEAQTVAPDTISTIITIQTQNSGGSSEQIDETSDLAVSVNSPTGQFNSNATTWNPAVTFTMSKNTANKNFYFMDSTSGTFIITAKLTTRVTGKSFTATQNITIGSSSGAGYGEEIGTTTATSTDDTASSIATTTATTTSSGNTYSNNVSVHYIQEDLSDYDEPTTFEISAGRARLSYVNSPVSFIAKHKTSKDLVAKSCNYIWSFGDGLAKNGEKVEHSYKYPGDYNVVLNGNCYDLSSVSRTVIKVIRANLAVSTIVDGAVEIINQGKYEINLYGYKLQALNQVYTFPQDTIISVGKSVIFPQEYLKISTVGNVVSLLDAVNNQLAQTDSIIVLAKVENVVSRADFDKFTLEYNRLMEVKSTPTILGPVRQGVPLTASVADNYINQAGSSSTTETIEIQKIAVEAPSRGFWTKMFHPIRTIKEAFYR